MLNFKSLNFFDMMKLLGKIYPVSPFRLNKSPYKVEVFITEQCNCRCKTCNVWARNFNNFKDMSVEAIINSVSGMKDLTWIGLSGGEPTMRDDFSFIAKEISLKYPDLMALNFGTNGLDTERVLQHTKNIAELKIPFTASAISIDGIGELHDTIRGVEGAFEKVMQTAEGMKELEKAFTNFNMLFQTTISEHNISQVTEISRYLHDRFPETTQIFTVATNSFLVGRNIETIDFSSEKNRKYFRQLIKVYPLNSINSILPFAYLGLLTIENDYEKYLPNCVAGKDIVILDANGDVRMCDYLQENEGNIVELKTDFNSIIKSQEYKEHVKTLKHCKKCFTPCQAFPSMLKSPLSISKGFSRALQIKLSKS